MLGNHTIRMDVLFACFKFLNAQQLPQAATDLVEP